MTEATVSATGGSTNAPPKGGQGSAAKGTYVALAIAVVAAGAGWSQYFNTAKQLEATQGDVAAARSDIDAMKAQFAGVGLDPASPQTLGLSIAAQRRVLTDLENALVAKSAAAHARDSQVAKAAGVLERMQAASAAAGAAETAASALFKDLDGRNRVLTGRVAELESSAVSWAAAAGARRGELDKLVAEVEANRALIADAAMWRDDGARLSAEQARLASAVTELENKVVSLAAAVNYRQGELSKAVVALSDAQADERAALRAALDLRAESVKLTRDIAGMTVERDRVRLALTDVNNRFVPALAAVTVREKQLQTLVGEVGRQQAANAELAAANADLQSRLAAADERLAEITTVAGEAAKHLKAIDDLLGTPTVQAALAVK